MPSFSKRRFYTPFFASTSSASSSTQLTSRSPSHVVVDLADPQVKDAVNALMNLKPLRHKVRSATIHANTLLDQPGRFGRIQFDMAHVLYIFEKLASLPNLTSVTIELNFHVISLPVKALLTLMTGCKLKRLTLKHLQLIGTCMDEFDQLAELVAATQDTLTSLTLECVRGISGVQALVQNLPNLTDLRMTSTALAPLPATDSSSKDSSPYHNDIFVQLLTPRLQTLKLDDIAELDDAHCMALAEALALPGCQLQELTVSSSMLSDASAKAMTDMLLVNTSLRKVTLHIDSELLGGWAAQVIGANTPTLEHLDVRLYNDIPVMTQDCLALAHALSRNSHLKHLRVRLEIELELLPKEIIQAYEAALLQTPTVVLQSLSLDDGIYRYPLPAAVKLQLHLNQCGVTQLLQQPVAPTVAQLVDTLVVAASNSSSSSNSSNNSSKQQDKQLDATFTLLREVPELIQLALENGNLDGSIKSNNNMEAPASPRKTPGRTSSGGKDQWKKISLTSLKSKSKKVVKLLIPPSA